MKQTITILIGLMVFCGCMATVDKESKPRILPPTSLTYFEYSCDCYQGGWGDYKPFVGAYDNVCSFLKGSAESNAQAMSGYSDFDNVYCDCEEMVDENGNRIYCDGDE